MAVGCPSMCYDKKNMFDIEKYLDHRLKLKPSDTYEVIEETEE